MICMRCMVRPSSVTVWQKFDDPKPYSAEVRKMALSAGVTLPKAPQGVWIQVCSDCVKFDDWKKCE
jgi:hypothetical protein